MAKQANKAKASKQGGDSTTVETLERRTFDRVTNEAAQQAENTEQHSDEEHGLFTK